MKTTFDIADPLLREARRLAAREGTTLRELVEQGLRKVVAERKQKLPFQLRKASIKTRPGNSFAAQSMRGAAVDRT
jgi:hypothetical protein